MVKKFYKNPSNGYKVDDGHKLCILWSFILGPLYFAIRGNWGWFFISAILALASLGLSYFIVPLFTRKINRTNLLRKGYVECQ